MDWNRILAGRTASVEFSGIRRFFELASHMEDPCDLSIGLPDYDVPERVKQAAIDAIRAGRNRYTPTAGLPELLDRLHAKIAQTYGLDDFSVLITSGVSGGLLLALLATIDPGDEIVFADPYFVSYLQLARIVGGTPVPVSTYPDFSFDAAAIEAAITPRTKVLMINSPGNPTGRVMTESEIRDAAELARRHNLVLIADEIYDALCYDGPSPSPMRYAPDNTVVVRGFGKTYGLTGWRMGYAAGPAAIINEMTKFQQFTYVCAPSMAQHAMLAALDTDVSEYRRDYARKRDLVCERLAGHYEFQRPGGGFYVFAAVPSEFPNATAFCEESSRRSVLVIPGNIFSERDTHFRISYATTDELIHRGCDVLCGMAKG